MIRYNDSEQLLYDMDMLKKTLKVIWVIITFAADAVISVIDFLLLSPTEKADKRRQNSIADQEPNGDGAWDIHPKHYYDEDPPPPFS